MPRRLLTLAVCLTFVSAVLADDWPRWRGLSHDAISTEKGLLDEWEEMPPLIWKSKGLGFSEAGVTVAGGIACTMGNHGNNMSVIAVSDETGEEIWRTEVGTMGGQKNRGSMCTPTMDGERIYALSSDGNLVCLKTATGERIWEKSFKRDYEGEPASFGYAESPFIDGDRLICSPGGPEAAMVALDKKTGEEIWRCKLSRKSAGAAYSTVVISHGAGIKQYVQRTQGGLVGVNAETGKELWIDTRFGSGNDMPTVIVRGDYVFVPCGWYHGSALLKLVPKEDGGVEAERVYFITTEKFLTRCGGAVLVGDYIYGCHAQTGMPQCIEFLTGKLMWEKDVGPSSGTASVISADGHLYFKYENGVVALVAATPDKYEVKGQFNTRNGCLAHPAISNGRLYLRTRDGIHCHDLKKK